MFVEVFGQHPYPRARTVINQAPGWPTGGPPSVYGMAAHVVSIEVNWEGPGLHGLNPIGKQIYFWDDDQWKMEEIIDSGSNNHVRLLAPRVDDGDYHFMIAKVDPAWDWQALAKFYASGVTGLASTVRWHVIHSNATVATLTSQPYWNSIV